MQLSFIFLLFSFARAFDSVQRAHHNRIRRAPLIADSPTSIPTTPSLPLSPPSSLPSLTSPSVPLPSSPSSSVPPQSTYTSSPNLAPSPSPTSPSSQPSSVPLPSSTPSSSTTPSSVVTSTASAPSASVTVTQSQPTSSSTPITLPDGASAPTQDSSSVVVLTSPSATPSSTATQSSSSGFFGNTGAVAGTFTVVGLFSIAGVIAVVLLVARRRRSHPYEEDTEYLDKSPDLSANPPITQITSIDDGSATDHAHYSAPPMALPTPPAAYYPDHAYTFHPQAFSPEAYPPSGQYGSHPVAPTQDYPPQRIYFPEDYDIAYPPSTSRVGANMPNPHDFTDVELVSAPAPPTQTALPSSLRPSVNSTPSAPKQWASTRFSVDSFYTGIANDTPSSSGQAL